MYRCVRAVYDDCVCIQHLFVDKINMLFILYTYEIACVFNALKSGPLPFDWISASRFGVDLYECDSEWSVYIRISSSQA